MDWLGDPWHSRGHDVARAIAAEHSHVTRLEPLGAGSVQPRRVGGDWPWALRITSSPASGTNQHNIAAADFHTRFLLPRGQVFGIDGRTGREISNAFEARNVHEDSARKNPILEIGDCQFGSALAGD